MADELQTGMTVQLKSGGPLMDVGLVENGHARCWWVDDDGNTQAASFSIETLVIMSAQVQP